MCKPRDEHGRFAQGNDFGQQHRWSKGVSGNPDGRPRGVNGCVRDLRSARYGRAELEDVLMDEHEGRNRREAAMRLLLEEIAKDPPFARFRCEVDKHRADLATTPIAELRWLVADPREDNDRRVAAYQILDERDALIPRTREALWNEKRQAKQEFRWEMCRRMMRGDCRM